MALLVGCGTGSPTGSFCLTCSVDIDSMTRDGGVIGADSYGETDRIKAKQLADSNCQLRGYSSANMSDRDLSRSWRAYYPYVCVSTNHVVGHSEPVASNDMQSKLSAAKEKCRDLGFKPNTDGFGSCVLRLAK